MIKLHCVHHFRTQSSISTSSPSPLSETVSSPAFDRQSQEDDNATLVDDNFDTQSVRSTDSIFDRQFSPVSVAAGSSASGGPPGKKRKLGGQSSSLDPGYVLQQFLANRPNFSQMASSRAPADAAQKYCDSLAETLRKLPQLAFTRAKMKINRIIDEEELAWAESQAAQQQSMQYVILDVQPEEQPRLEQHKEHGEQHQAQQQFDMQKLTNEFNALIDDE